MEQRRHPYSLIGIDGNAFSIIAYTIKAMKECGYSRDAVETYKSECLYSDNYDDLLSTSIDMIEKCNKASGYDDPFQQFLKGHDDLEYVDGFYIRNKREQLVNESWDNDYFSEPTTEDFTYHTDSVYMEDDLEEKFIQYEKDHENDIPNESDDFYQLRNELINGIANKLNNIISDGNYFTRTAVTNALCGPNSIINDEMFWSNLEEEIPDFPLNESVEKSDYSRYLRGALSSTIIKILNGLILNDVKFSKYDVRQVLTLIATTEVVYSKLDKYVQE